jgi:acetolactate synthase small subunit
MSTPSRLTLSLSTALEPAANETAAAPSTCFAVHAIAEPGVISRVLEQFAKRGLMPARLVADGSNEVGLLDIDIQVPNLTAQDGKQIARSLRAIIGVCVVVSS